jgi:CheY-like chemotaxis protein
MKAVTPEASPKNRMVLMVDDEKQIRELMKMYLEACGFDVITAANGLEGLRRYWENKNRIQVVVTDLDMPTMNGADMVRQIQKTNPAMKIIIASGSPAQRSMGTFFVSKPYTPRELAAAVTALHAY